MVDANVAQGVLDGTNAALNGTGVTEDIFHFFALKKKLDVRVKGITFDRF
jgi:hypothetical protein